LDDRAPESFRDLYDRYVDFVRRTARRLGVAESSLDDVCQDVFLSVYRRLAEFEGRSAFRTWLFGFVYNTARTHCRTLKRRDVTFRATGPLVDPDEVYAEDVPPDEQASTSEQVRLARALLEEMTPQRQEAFLLIDWVGLTGKEAAAETHCNINTLYSRLRDARRELAEATLRAPA
jgi:RNA polymerase sigma-70 factor (ECF subfamily)